MFEAIKVKSSATTFSYRRFNGMLTAKAFDRVSRKLADAITSGTGPYKAFFDEALDCYTRVGPLFDIDVLWEHFIKLYRIPDKFLQPSVRSVPSECSDDEDIERGTLSPLNGFDIAWRSEDENRESRRKKGPVVLNDDDEDEGIDDNLHTTSSTTAAAAKAARVVVDVDCSPYEKEPAPSQQKGVSERFFVVLPDGSTRVMDDAAVAPLKAGTCLHNRCADLMVSRPGLACVRVVAERSIACFDFIRGR